MDENLTNLPERAKWFFDADKEKLAKENALILFDEGKIPDTSIDTAKAYCARCKIGTHKCSVQTRYGWCCDLCVEEELLALRLCGVHTMGSYCGHGDQRLASVLVVGDGSKDIMRELGYELVDDMPEHRMSNWRPKSKMMYEIQEEPK